ncbi:MAG: hypothetical protein ACRDY0_08965 [Acidimicrobiales bacterium]
MTWDVDFTQQVLADRVGLEPQVNEAITDVLLVWLKAGPPRGNARDLAGMTVYEERVAIKYLLGYVINDERRRFALLWLRQVPA